MALPEALDGLERRLLLAQLVGQWARAPDLRGAAGMSLVAQTPAAACALADDLARLIDDMEMRGVSWDRLDELVPDQFDQYWQLTLAFLRIAREIWPAIVHERGLIEPARRRDLLIKAQAERLAHNRGGPVIAAGSTGSIPATAELIATIARLPHGAVVLPGLDTALDAHAWQTLAQAPGHPQFAMHALLARIGIEREAVENLARPLAPERLVWEALRPAASTELWRQTTADVDFAALAEEALRPLTLIEAANAEEEALAIAVALREAVHAGKSAALVTPDRALGRRVMAALGRWAIEAEDTGGDALADTPAGIFARLAAEAALGGLVPVVLLALLKHPLLRLGGDRREHAIAALERAVLRGPRPGGGTAGLAKALSAFRSGQAALHGADPRAKLTADELAAAEALSAALGAALDPLESLPSAPLAFAAIAERHRAVLSALSRDATAELAFAGADGAQLAKALDELATSEAAAGCLVAPRDYVELFGAALADRVVRRPPRRELRVRIFGLLEARLIDSDRVVLGGLNEGTWPPQSRSDPWLSRPMRLKLGLDVPERRIGLTAHDFAQLVSAREVIITRAAKIAGAPTNPSRFLQRLAAVAGEQRWQTVVARGHAYLAWARQLDRPEKATPIAQPAPTPPRAARPNSLSVTEIEDWLRDPYTIYAKHVLNLRPLDPVDADPGAAERGAFIHAAIGEFTTRFADALPRDPAAELIRIGRKHFANLEDFPEARAFWWPRFVRIAHWFAGFELERRVGIAALAAEIKGEIAIPLAQKAPETFAQATFSQETFSQETFSQETFSQETFSQETFSQDTFSLRGIADRIERRGDGRYVIFDYKTGAARTEKQVRTGLAPQLTLEAAILRGGGFAPIPAGASVADIGYVLLKGADPPGAPKPISFKDGTPDHHADRALERLTALVRRFADENEPYRSLVHPMWTTHYGVYDHLARVKEWSSTGGAADENAIVP
jgi:ATP-dependent helicase/nuclease subunit B